MGYLFKVYVAREFLMLRKCKTHWKWATPQAWAQRFLDPVSDVRWAAKKVQKYSDRKSADS